MELQFKKTTCDCLKQALRDVQNAEETLEIRLPEALPDIGRILAAWGQPILRSKEWRSGGVAFSGGMMVWVLYMPEEEQAPRCMEGWIPFQMRWDLPEGTPEGRIHIRLRTRFVDARSTSARKIMVRCGMAALAEAWTQVQVPIWQPPEDAAGAELLRSRYPLRLRREAGEKVIELTEDLTLPASAPQPEKLLYYTLSPEVTDRKVIANKTVFRGNANLHLLYESREGQLFCWDFPLAFSQYVEMDRSRGADAQSDVSLCVTNLELELDDEGILRLKCAMVGQYLVEEPELVEVVTDAYSTRCSLEQRSQLLELPVVLDSRREDLRGEQPLPGSANVPVDTALVMDYPRRKREDDGVRLVFPCSMQLLSYGDDGVLQSASTRWETEHQVKAGEESLLEVLPEPAPAPQIILGSGTMEARWETGVAITTTAHTQIPMITGLQPGAPTQTDPDRPSLILKRVDQSGLWDIAKSTGSTMAAIAAANGLQGEPEPGQLLLIPIS